MRAAPRRRAARLDLAPMLATPATDPPADGDAWVYEPKYDGVRVTAVALDGRVALLSRNGNDKAPQFPELARALGALARQRGGDEPLVVDGEIVATDEAGQVRRFEALQSRIHERGGQGKGAGAALVVFDVLVDRGRSLLEQPWRARRRVLDAIDGLAPDDDGTALLRRSTVLGSEAGGATARAQRQGWEGVMAKRAAAPYAPGARSRDWLKLKLEHREEFVVGGFTAPQGSREGFGALLLGYYTPGGALAYAGHTGTGFDRRTLATLARAMRRLRRRTPPFAEPPRTNTPATWVRPELVVEIRFNEWTASGKLRQPVFVGLRDDKSARDVVYDRESGVGNRESESTTPLGTLRSTRPDPRSPIASARATRSAARGTRLALTSAVVAQIDALASAGDEGTIELAEGVELDVTSLRRIVFPKGKRTKGDVLRYYATVAPALLPALRDRPLVLKRYPNGVGKPAFYQQEAPAAVPPFVRVEELLDPEDPDHARRRFVGGELTTLLYCVQMSAISTDPWHSRVGSLDDADYTIIDLDPGEGTSFARVREVARRAKEELDALGLRAVLKTSGATGMHIVLPLPPGVPNESARLLAELVATRVARRAPRIATIERRVSARPPGTVYVDFLQNIRGKTVASVYALRATPDATVSTPLDWDELTDDLDPREFTIDTLPERLRARGDLWAAGMREPNSLEGLLDKLAAARGAA